MIFINFLHLSIRSAFYGTLSIFFIICRVKCNFLKIFLKNLFYILNGILYASHII